MNEWILPLIQTIGLGVVLPAVATWLGLKVKDKFLRDALTGAANRAAGIAYDYLASRSAGLDAEAAKRNAFNAALTHIEMSVPTVIKALGVTGDTVANLVRGELGQLLARDSAISVAPQVQPNVPEPLAAPVIPMRGPVP